MKAIYGPAMHLAKVAKQLVRKARNGNANACTTLRAAFTEAKSKTDLQVAQWLTVMRAQHAVAIHYGFSSWAAAMGASPAKIQEAIDRTEAGVSATAPTREPFWDSEHSRVLGDSIVPATAGDVQKTEARIMGEAFQGLLKPHASGINTLSSARLVKDYTKPDFGRLKFESPLHQLGKLSVSSQIVAQKIDLTSAVQSLRIPKIQTAADLLTDIVPVNPIAEQKRRLREMMFGSMDRIKAAIKASRPKRVRKPRPKKPPIDPPSAD